MKPRWTEDTRGRGIASAGPLIPDLDNLRTAMADRAWVAEEPEAHLLPHIRRAIEQDGSGWKLVEAVNEDHVLKVTLQRLERGNHADLRAAAMALAGTFAEANTFMRERREGPFTIFDIATGMLDGDGPFAGHGHVVRLVIEA